MWCRKADPGTVTQKAVSPRLALLASIDTDGRIYYALSHANTDADTMSLFILHLVRQLDNDIPGWKDDSVMLLDNASWHKGDEIIEVLRDLKIPLMFSAQYSYSSAPIELMFSGLK